MTPALARVRAEADRQLRLIGPRPPWWRPWARRRWSTQVRGVMAYVFAAAADQALADVWARLIDAEPASALEVN